MGISISAHYAVWIYIARKHKWACERARESKVSAIQRKRLAHQHSQINIHMSQSLLVCTGRERESVLLWIKANDLAIRDERKSGARCAPGAMTSSLKLHFLFILEHLSPEIKHTTRTHARSSHNICVVFSPPLPRACKSERGCLWWMYK